MAGNVINPLAGHKCKTGWRRSELMTKGFPTITVVVAIAFRLGNWQDVIGRRMSVILDALKRGERLSLELLACHYADVSEFWNWWWATKADYTRLSLPYTIADGDPILTPTVEKQYVDTRTGQEFFSEFLLRPLKAGILSEGTEILRRSYRKEIVDYLLHRGTFQDKPSIVFVGGGYGAGKTTTLSFLATNGAIPVPMSSLLGIDYCKLHIPEFDRVRLMADGRASEVCQEESRLIANDLFIKLIEEISRQQAPFSTVPGGLDKVVNDRL